MLVLEILIILFLFLGPSICVLFGWSTIDNASSVFKAIHPIIYLLLLYVGLNYRRFFSRKFFWTNAVVIVVIVLLFRILFGLYLEARIFGNLLTPLLFAFFISEVARSKHSVARCRRWFIFLFVVETSLALFERISFSLVFPYSLYSPEDINGMVETMEYFRSNSLLGHPLSNALCVAVTTAVIAVSDLSNKLKYSLLTLGLISLLCFNARFAIIISFSFFFLYYILKHKLRVSTLIFIVGGAAAILYLALSFNLGDRLLSGGTVSDDTSILARFDVFDMLEFIDFELIYKGTGLQFVERSLGMLHIENWLLIILFDLGVLVSLYYIYIVIKIPLLSLQHFSFYDRAYIFATFIIIASSNNSLAAEVPVISFMLAASVLLPYRNIQPEITKKVSSGR